MSFELSANDFPLIAILVFLEGILSVDNALVLAIIAKHLPKDQRKKALAYGLIGAFIFRFVALLMATFLTKWMWVKFVGGAYLLYLAIRHLVWGEDSSDVAGKTLGKSFWRTVVLIELTDIAFAVDSILAGVALTNKLWVVFLGGILGIVMMRFAAAGIIRLIEKFPKLERTAYLLVFVIGVKVILEGLRLDGVDFHSPKAVSFWIFWAVMAACVGYGFWRRPGKKKT